MVHPWLLLPFLFSYVLAKESFENTAIVRTIELEGSLTAVSTVYSVRALEDGASEYTFLLGREDGQATHWADARLKGSDSALALSEQKLDEQSGTWSYTTKLETPLKRNENITLSFSTVQSNVVVPYPAEVAQTEPQSFRYHSDLFVRSPYATPIQRTKLRTPTPSVHNYSIPASSDFASSKDKAPASKSGATITYGPFSSLPASASAAFLAHQQRISVHFESEQPVVRVKSLRRAVEVSHWGANLNVDNWMHVLNDGARLKGHFSRLQHQVQTYQQKPAYGTLRALTLHLPPDISPPYFYDTIGNVSTSRFRPASKASRGERHSVIEMRPRYPVMGGWNYSFTLGWDAPFEHAVKYDKEDNRYILGVPFMTPIYGAAVDRAEVTIILPEGATDVEVHPPFPMKSMERITHITYLDTKGRPAIVFTKDQVTDQHTDNIYISYKVPFSAHLTKPVAVGTATLGLFFLGLIAKRIDPRLERSATKNGGAVKATSK